MKSRKLLFLAVFGWLFMTIYSCQNMSIPSDSANELKIDYEKYTLDNGLDIILHKDASDPIAAVAILFNVGSNREKPGRTGFAHFFEHMLFQNSENVGKGNFFKIIEDLGGDFNGGTWQDGTIYYEVIPKDALEKILWMESDRMGFMINTVTEAVFENEKQIVKNEKRQRVDNQPYGHTRYVQGKALYPEGHPYNWQTIGSLEDLQAAKIEDVKEFYDKWYGPNNATMVIAGDIDFEETKAMIEKYFAEIPKKQEVVPIEPKPAVVNETTKLMHEDNFAELPELNMVWPSVEDGHEDGYALNYLANLLSDGKRAALYKEIVENQKLAPSPYAVSREGQIAGTFNIVVRGNDGVDLDQVHDAVLTSLKNFEENEIDDRDMERIKNSLETSFYNGISSVFGKSFQLAQYNEFRGSPNALSEEIKKILAVTKDDVRRVYQKYIKGKPYLVTSFVPKGKPELALEGSELANVVEEEIVPGAEPPPLPEDNSAFEKTPSNIDRSKQPELGDPPTINQPKIWDTTLDNGLAVYGIENSELPLVVFSIRLKGGLYLDDIKKTGVANLVTDMMMEGTKNKTPEQLEDAIGQLGASINMSASAEFISLSANSLSRNFEDALALFEEILLEPRWDEAEFERLKKQTITQIQQRSAQPSSIANKIFAQQIYGKEHILSNSPLGTIESVQSITLDDLKAFYEKQFSPSIASFHVVGAVSQDQVMETLQSLQSKWAKKAVEFPSYPEPQIDEDAKIVFVDIPNAKQSVLRIGHPLLKGNDENYFAATLVNQRLGGGTSARLFQQMREERQYTYGAGSTMPRRIHTGYFMGYSSVRTNVTKESVGLFKQILDEYKEDYAAEDLEKTKSSKLKGNALAFETLYDKMSILQNISTYDLPKNYVDKEQQVIIDMTLDKAKSLIDKYIQSNKMVYVVVGDAATQVDRLKDLGLGDPIMLDKEGVPLEDVPN